MLLSDVEIRDVMTIKATIQIDDNEINELYEKGASIYALPEELKMNEGTPREYTIFPSLRLSLIPTPNACRLVEEII